MRTGSTTSIFFLTVIARIAGKTMIVESNANDKLTNVIIPKFDRMTKSEKISALNPPIVVNAETKIGFVILDIAI